jgi:predicted membrane-bound mannosyltransferase
VGVWAVVALVLFSSFFTNAAGPLDSVRTYLPWLHRAGGDSPHIHPWSFYVHRLLFFHEAKGPAWTEAFIFALALLATAAAFARRGLGDANASFVRFLALYAFSLLAAYSLIAYKTPWCLLTFWQPMLLLAGIGAVITLRSVKTQLAKSALGLVLLAGAAQLSVQAWQASVPYAADPRNPYVYAQTSPDVLRLVSQVESLAAVHPEGQQMMIKVMAPDHDYWPLPWYLRGFKRVGWWAEVPADPYAPVMIVSSQFHANLDEKKTHLMIGYFQLRPGTFFELYVELDLWRVYLVKHPPKRED